MSPVRFRFLGCGDAFGSGGRLHTCFHLEGGGEPVLIDCGATVLQALKRERIDPASIGWVALSHLHGDHFGGLPWLILDGRFARRSKPLVISGPVGTEERLTTAFEALYPGAPAGPRPFELRFVEYEEGQPVVMGPAVVTPFEVIHRSGAPSYALRVQYGGKVLTYSGDTEWTERLADAARGADLFVCECNYYDKRVQGHLDYQTLSEMRPRFECRQLVITHMSDDMLAHVDDLDVTAAHDGMTLEV
ncbi:MAG: MBL fold metallo-hydrolase [Solirubrobacteraceae bacterium]